MNAADSPLFSWAFGLSLVALLSLSTLIYLPLELQAGVAWSLVGLLILVRALPVVPADLQRLVICSISLFLTFRYFVFRAGETLFFDGIPDGIAVLALFAAETYGIVIHLLGLFVNISPYRRGVQPVDLNRPDLPSVAIFIPTYNESEEIIATSVMAGSLIDYPKEKYRIFILDDGGTWQKRNDPDPAKAAQAWERHRALKQLAERMGVVYLTRERNDHAKAGNLNKALEALHGCEELNPELATLEKLDHSICYDLGIAKSIEELVLILDCDHVPSRDILKNTVGLFLDDPKLFLVQTPHFFINPDPIEKNLDTSTHSPGENEMFYGAVHHGMDFWNASFFCGSAALLRRSHLDAIGGIQGETITEDAETALALHARGLRSAYVGKPMVCGLSPETFTDFILQRSRWTQGMIQIFMLKNPLFIKGLRPYQRLCYLSSCIFWFFGLARFLFWAAPLAYLFFELRVYNASMEQIAAYALPHLLAALLVADYLFGLVRHPFFSELYETVQSIFLTPAILSAMRNPKAPTFKVTPKGQSLSQDTLSPLAVPFYIMLGGTLVSYPFGFWRWVNSPLQQDAVLLCMAWTTFNLIMILLAMGIVWEKRQVRAWHRLPVRETVVVDNETAQYCQEGVVLDVSLGGIRFDLPADFPAQPGDHIRFTATDSQGHVYELKLNVTRAHAVNGRAIVSGRFVTSTQEELIDVVGYAFGDSDRWESFWLRRRSRVGFFRSIIFLLVRGIGGTARNFTGLTRLTVSILATLFTDMLRKAPSTSLKEGKPS